MVLVPRRSASSITSSARRPTQSDSQNSATTCTRLSTRCPHPVSSSVVPVDAGRGSTRHGAVRWNGGVVMSVVFETTS